MRLVVLESPYGHRTASVIAVNEAYARACIADSLRRGEAPIASHLLYTQPGILKDSEPHERAHGISAGHSWIRVCDAVVVYTDRGISPGMREAIRLAEKDLGTPVEYRTCAPDLWPTERPKQEAASR